jgi:hypothetical protein
MKNNINWLAQCKRRIDNPKDLSEEVGFSAFEYGWKSFNNLYSNHKGKKSREQMHRCINLHVNAEKFIKVMKSNITDLCDGSLNMDFESHKSLMKYQLQANELKKLLSMDKHTETMESLIDCLYSIRNARTHGDCCSKRELYPYLPRLILELNILILCNENNVTRMKVDSLIENQIEQICLKKVA